MGNLLLACMTVMCSRARSIVVLLACSWSRRRRLGPPQVGTECLSQAVVLRPPRGPLGYVQQCGTLICPQGSPPFPPPTHWYCRPCGLVQLLGRVVVSGPRTMFTGAYLKI